MNSENDKSYVGIDVGKANLDVSLPSGEHFVCTNDKTGFKKLLDSVKGLSEPCFVFEASGGYEKSFRAFLEARGDSLICANPYHARQFAKCRGLLAKTDRIDAGMLREYGAFKISETSRICPETAKLRLLVDRRRQLKKLIVIEKTHNEHAEEIATRSITRVLKLLQKEVKELDKKIAAYLLATPSLQKKAELLRSHKGIGEVVAFTLLAHLPELGHMGRKQIAALAGLAPYAHDSGKFRGKRYLQGGRQQVRSAMYMAVLTAFRHHPDLQPFCARLAHKPKKTVLLACARKLLVRVNGQMRDLMMENQVSQMT